MNIRQSHTTHGTKLFAFFEHLKMTTCVNTVPVVVSLALSRQARNTLFI